MKIDLYVLAGIGFLADFLLLAFLVYSYEKFVDWKHRSNKLARFMLDRLIESVACERGIDNTLAAFASSCMTPVYLSEEALRTFNAYLITNHFQYQCIDIRKLAYTLFYVFDDPETSKNSETEYGIIHATDYNTGNHTIIEGTVSAAYMFSLKLNSFIKVSNVPFIVENVHAGYPTLLAKFNVLAYFSDIPEMQGSSTSKHNGRKYKGKRVMK